jgi:hypothetical protein
MSIILDAIKMVINLKQKEGESLHDYTKRFKTARDVMRSHLGGPLILSKYVKSMDEYDESNKDTIEKCNERSFSQFLAYTYLENSDKAKYGSLLVGLQTQQSLKNNQYPKSLTEANNVLSNHHFDNANKVHHKTKDNEKENEKTEEKPELSFAMLEGKCYCCGNGGHKSPTCRLKDKIPK